MKVQYSVEALIEGIKNRENDVLTYIYQNYFQMIKSYILKNCGDEEDARDVFQEALIVIFKKVKSDLLVLNCSFQSYLFSVSRFLWLQQIELRKISLKERLDDHKPVDIGDDIFQISVENERYNLYRHHFDKLGDECREILSMFLDKVPLKTIADKLGLKTEKYAKKRKYQCKEVLINNIKNDLRYRHL
jgi:RNA polymerase sigma factor (sigma-70 family)